MLLEHKNHPYVFDRAFPEYRDVNIQLHYNIFITFKALYDWAPEKHMDSCIDAFFHISKKKKALLIFSKRKKSNMTT